MISPDRYANLNPMTLNILFSVIFFSDV